MGLLDPETWKAPAELIGYWKTIAGAGLAFSAANKKGREFTGINTECHMLLGELTDDGRLAIPRRSVCQVDIHCLLRLEKGCTLAKAAKAAKAAEATPVDPFRAAAASPPKPPPPPKALARAQPRRAARKSAAGEVDRFLAVAAAAPKPAPVIDRPIVEPIVEVPPLLARAPFTMAEILRSYGHIREVA
jgi:hypothetical protein